MDGGRNRRGQGEADWILMSGCNAIKPALSPSSHFSWQLLSDPRKHHQTSINLLTKKPRKKKKTSYLYSHKIKSWHGQKVSQSMLNTEKTHSIETNINYFVMKDRGITEKGEKWVMDWSEMQNLVIVGKFYACLPILFPHCRKKPNLNPNKLIFIKRGFLVSLIYCFLSRLTEDPYFIVSYNCCVW